MSTAPNFAFLPLEILVAVGLTGPEAWRDMLAIPNFARSTTTRHAKKMLHKFIVRETIGNCTKYRLAGRLHNFEDQPAIIWAEGNLIGDKDFPSRRETNYYFQRITPQGSKGWFKNGGKVWFKHGVISRENDLPNVIHDGNSYEWYKGNYLHRDGDKPAIISWDYQSMFWYKNGKLHRENGAPCIVGEIVAGNRDIEWNTHDKNTGICGITEDTIYYENGAEDKMSQEYFEEILKYYLNSWPINPAQI